MRWCLPIVLGVWLAGWSATARGETAPPETAAAAVAREQQEHAMRDYLELRQWQPALPKIQAAPLQAIPPDLAKPLHIMFFFVDHWEPSSYPVFDPDTYLSEATRLSDYWLVDYPKMASRHRDADGKMPQHTWFTFQLYTPPLDRISKACFLGLGEMEIHLHHGTSNDNQSDNRVEFINKIRNQLTGIQGRGGCLTAERLPRTFFGFIHGDWALDNSRLEGATRKYCGVNNELFLLRALGCYGDFTFPSGEPTTPAWNNKIFLSKDSDVPKSYDDISLIRELVTYGDPIGQTELMIFEGPGYRGGEANIDENFRPTLERMDQWVNEYVHVPGRNNWLFIKVFTHSAQTLSTGGSGYSNMVGAQADQFYTEIEAKYNDGKNYQLHYVTSREAYNIACAAAAGLGGNPNQYRDYAIAAPANAHLYVNTAWRLMSLDLEGERIELEIKEKPAKLELWAHDFKPGLSIHESDTLTTSSFYRTNGVIGTSEQARLVFQDATPSKYYKIFKAPPAAKQGWRRYQ